MEAPRMYSLDHKVDQHHQQQQQQHLPTQWTTVDQEIIEDLLLVEPAVASAHASPTVSNHEYAQMHMFMDPHALSQHQQSVVFADDAMGSAAVHPSSHFALTRAPQIELMAQGLSPGAMGPTTAEEVRKAKHREVQRRFMLRKKEQIKKTKKLASELELKYNVLKLSVETNDLQVENKGLEADIAERDPGAAYFTKEQVGLVLDEQLKMVREHYDPITDPEWSDLLQKNIDDYEVTSREPNYVSSGASVLGWSDRRKQEENGSLKFIMSKQFPFLNAADFMNTTWAKLWLPETHSSLFNAAVTIKTQILQHINEDTIVLHRAMFNPLTNGIIHSVETLCRIQHGHDYIVFLRCPDRMPVHKCVMELYDWVHIWTSLAFTPLPSRQHGVSGCMFRYGGMLKDFSVPDIKYWLMEMLWVLLRFESVMVSPVFALLPEELSNESSSSANSSPGSSPVSSLN